MSQTRLSPVLSICVAVFNVEDFLEECLSSLHKISSPQVEILLINDCSTDGSKRICERYAAKDIRVDVINHGINKGLLQVRKTGITSSTGKYILFVDGDDKVIPEKLSEFIKILNCMHEDIVQFGVICFGKPNFAPEKYQYPFSVDSLTHTNDLLKIQSDIFVKGKIPWNVFNKFYKRELAVKAASAIDEKNITSGEDAFLTFILTELATSYSTYPVYCYAYRIGSGISKGDETIEKFAIHVKDIKIPSLIEDFFNANLKRGYNETALKNLYFRLLELTIKRFWNLPLKEKAEGLKFLAEVRIPKKNVVFFGFLILLKNFSHFILPIGSSRRELIKNIWHSLK